MMEFKKELANENYLGAKDILMELVVKGDANAMYILGEMLLEGGLTLKINRDRACYWFEKSANLGHFRSKYNLGCLTDRPELIEEAGLNGDNYCKGCYHFRKDYNNSDWINALEYFLADPDDMFCQYMIGHYYYCFFSNNRKLMMIWYEKAALQGYSKAQYYYGWHLSRGANRDLTKAWRYMRKAAIQKYRYVEDELCKPIFMNFTRHDKTRNTLLSLICIRRFKHSSLDIFPKDIILIVARDIWNTRNEEIWGPKF